MALTNITAVYARNNLAWVFLELTEWLELMGGVDGNNLYTLMVGDTKVSL